MMFRSPCTAQTTACRAARRGPHASPREARGSRFGRAGRAQGLLLLLALLGQMVLPAAHASERARAGGDASSSGIAAARGTATGASFAPAPPHELRHDPASCAVCRSLVHSGHAALADGSWAPFAVSHPGAAAAASDPTARAPERRHPPRAPPTARSERHRQT